MSAWAGRDEAGLNGRGILQLEDFWVVLLLHLLDQGVLVRSKEVSRRCHANRGRPLKTKIVLVAEFELARQQRFPVLAPGFLKQIVKVSETGLRAELIEFHRGDSFDGCHHLGDAVGLGEGEEGGVCATDNGQDALLRENLFRGERFSDRLQRRGGKMNRVGDGESGQILRVRVFRALNTEVGGGGRQDVLRSWDGGRVKERSVLQHAAGGGRVDRGERLVRVGQAVGRADLHRSCARSSHRDEPSALLVLLDVERVWGPDGSDLELVL